MPTPPTWTQAEAKRLRSYHGGARDAGPTGQRSLIRRDRDEGFDSPPPPPLPRSSWEYATALRQAYIDGANRAVRELGLTPHDKSLIWQSLCARVDELRRSPNGYEIQRGDGARIQEMRELAEKLERLGIVALDLAGYAP